ncbi:MAG: ABC transporter ATP-binding protein [Oscillospiraceae bacterium]|nr:ABC transporter ATP-binding protein [Oscillospiraceae bacterium]
MIEVKNLTKCYGDLKAVSDLSFTIEKGQIYGFLGPNGAGKSTTMNIMTGCLAATSGEVRIGGYDIFEEPEKAKKLIGYLPEQPPLYMDRTPREYLTFVAQAKKIAKKDIAKQVARVMAITEIEEVADRLIKNLSKGYKQRVGIAQALLGEPEVIILDEPTEGLDPSQRIEIRQMIKELGRDHTVILSSHVLSEVQAVCQTIMIISRGKLVACDSAENLQSRFAGRISMELTVEAENIRAKHILSSVSRVTGTTVLSEENNVSRLALETNGLADADLCREIFFAFAKENVAILEMKSTKATLEDIFIELTGKGAKR